MTKTIEQYNNTLSDINGGSFSNLSDLNEGFAEKENGGFRSAVRRSGTLFTTRLYYRTQKLYFAILLVQILNPSH